MSFGYHFQEKEFNSGKWDLFAEPWNNFWPKTNFVACWDTAQLKCVYLPPSRWGNFCCNPGIPVALPLSPVKQFLPLLLEKEKKGGGRGFPGGAVVKNTPASAGDTGWIPGPGRSHMPWNN